MRKTLWGALAVLVWAAAGPALRADEAPKDRDKELAKLLDRAIKAHGGADILNKFPATTMKMKGKVHVMNQTFDFTGDFAVQMPDRIRHEINVDVMGMQFKQIQVLDKNKGWIAAAGQTREMNKEELEEAREEMHAGWVAGQLTPLLGKEYKLSSLGESKIGKRDAAGILVARKGYRDVNMYFDKKSGLLLKTESRVKDLMGGGQEVTQETFYDDYKDLQGVQVAHTLTMKRDGKDFLSGELTEVQAHEKLGDEHFAKP